MSHVSLTGVKDQAAQIVAATSPAFYMLHDIFWEIPHIVEIFLSYKRESSE
jgi:hypothetical protein